MGGARVGVSGKLGQGGEDGGEGNIGYNSGVLIGRMFSDDRCA